MTTVLFYAGWHGARQAQSGLRTVNKLLLVNSNFKSKFYSLDHQFRISSNPPKHKGKQPPSKFRQYIVSRYVQYVDRYERILESKFPSAMHVYRIFMVGIKEFYRDLKSFFQIMKKLAKSPDGLRCLTRQEIELYFQMPRDMKKVAPMLLLSALPLTNYVVFPLMYLFPRQLMCSHFWSLQQRVEFAVHYHRKRLLHYRPVFRAMQAQLDDLESHPLHCQWARILGLLGSGVHPRPKEIVECIELFRGEPYHVANMYSGHAKNLLQIHGMHTGWLRRKRLSDRALIVRHMDLAIMREGGPQKMNQDELRSACFLRGLNPVNMRHDDLVDWLEQWLEISQHVDKGSLSLLLHCPILLAYNHPTNWSLIY